MMRNSRTVAVGHLLAFITILIWGTTYISTKILLTDFSPEEILVYRFSIGYLVLLFIYPRFFKTRGIREELLFIVAGLCGVTLFFLLENIALTYTLASNVGLIVSIAPFFTAVLAHFFLEGERLRLQFFVGFIIAISGIMLIGWNGNVVLKLNPAGDLLAVLASMIWAVYSILMRKISTLGYHTIVCTRRVFFYGLLFMVPVLFLLDFTPNFDAITKSSNLLNTLYLGLGASAFCFFSWNWSVGVLGAVKTSAYIYMVPVITLSASFLVLRKQITGMALTGALLTIAGLFLSEKRQK